METFHPSRTAGNCGRLAGVCCSSGRRQSTIQPTPPTSFDTAAAHLLFVVLFLLVVGSLSGFALDSDAEEARRRGKKQAAGGLDPSRLALLPVVPFDAEEWGSEGRAVGGGWECPVCLTDFGGGDGVRLLPVCGHGFHAECIDAWLAGNATCPVCRNDLAEEKVAEGGGEADLVIAPAEEG